MSLNDTQGKGPVTNEARVEKNTSRATESKPSDNTPQRVSDTLANNKK
jgi:hypothetical protein